MMLVDHIVRCIIQPVARADTPGPPPTPWHPSALLDGYEGFYADFSTMDGVVQDGDTWMLGEHIFTGRNSPQLTDGGISFDGSRSQLLVGAESLAPAMGNYPITIAMNVASVPSGSIDTAIILGASEYYVLRCTASNNKYAVTRNTDYVQSAINSGESGGVLLGDYRTDRTALYVNDSGPAYHTSQPTMGSRPHEISIGGMSDNTPDYGTGILKSVFMVNRSLTDEERQKLLDYM